MMLKEKVLSFVQLRTKRIETKLGLKTGMVFQQRCSATKQLENMGDKAFCHVFYDSLKKITVHLDWRIL